MIELSEFERKTRELFAPISTDGAVLAIKMVFVSHHAMALDKEHMMQIAHAVYRHEPWPLAEWDRALRHLVRSKVLRSYLRRGIRLYEVNY